MARMAPHLRQAYEDLEGIPAKLQEAYRRGDGEKVEALLDALANATDTVREYEDELKYEDYLESMGL